MPGMLSRYHRVGVIDKMLDMYIIHALI